MAVVFVSHSTKDKTSALQVEAALKAAGHTVFVDTDHEDGIAPGTDWRTELFSAVTACNAVVFLNSVDSQASQWCHTELALAALHHKWVYAVNLTAHIRPHPLLEDKQGIRLETSLTDSLERLGATLTKDFAGLNASARWDKSRSPFPGLRSFEAADAGVFFGRDQAVGDVIRRLEDLEMTSDGNLLALIGPSGSGKSSLVKAGVLPRLADRGGVLIIGPFEPGNFPIDRLVAALRTAAPAVNASLDAATLQADGLSRVVGRMLDVAPDCRRALVVVDQVEYLGTVDTEERDAFLIALDGVITTGSKVTLLFIARQDRLEDVQRFAPLGRYITSPVAVLPIDADGLRLAVEEPAMVARMVVDPNLTRKVIEDAMDSGASDAGRALPLVAETLRAVYELATKNGRRQMTAEDYEAVGGVQGSIQRYAEQAEAQLGADGAALDALLPRFVTLEDDEHPAIGRPIALSLLDEDERRLVGRLQDVRLFTTDDDSVRIVHDRLIEAWPRLAKAVQARRKDLLFRAQLERQATEWAKGDGTEFLLGSESTEQAEELVAADTDAATPAMTRYIAASRHQLTRRRRRRNVIIGALSILTLVAVGLAAVANNSRRSAQRATAEAQARDLAARSTAADDPYDAALLAIEAELWTPHPLLETRTAWHRAETRLGQQLVLRSGGPITTGDGSALAVAWNPEGTTVATGNEDGTLRLFDATTHNAIGDVLAAGTSDIGGNSTWAVAWNPAGTTIATGNNDGTLRLFDATTRSPIGDPIATGNSFTLAVEWNRAGTIIAAGNGDGTVRLFDATTHRTIGDTMIAGASLTRTVSWNPEGTIIATGNDDGTLRLFDTTTHDQIGDPIVIGDPKLAAHSTEAVTWNPDGTIIAVGSDDGTLRLFDATTHSPIGDPIVIGRSPTTAVAWSPAGTTIATASGVSDGMLRLFDATTHSLIGDPIPVGDASTEAMAWNPAGTMIATGGGDGTLRLFDATTHSPSGNPTHTGAIPPVSVVWNSAGTTIATLYADGRLALFDATTRGPIGFPTLEKYALAVDWNPAGTTIAVGNDDGTLQLIDATTLRPIGDPMTTGDSPVEAVAWNPAGAIIASSSGDTMQLIDATTLRPIGDPIITDEGFTDVSWNPSGTIIATGNVDGTLRLFDATTHSPIGDPITSGNGFTLALAWSPAGNIIAAGNNDGTVRLFDATTHRPIGDPITSGNSFTLALAWNPAGTIIATGNIDGTLRLFDATTLRPIGDPMTAGGTHTEAVAWNPAGTTIATGNDDGTLRFFDSWTEADACDYLRTIMTLGEMDDLVGIDGAQSKCAHGGVHDLPAIPALDLALP